MNKHGYYKYLRKKHLKEQCDRQFGKKRLKPAHPVVVFFTLLIGSLSLAVFAGCLAKLLF